MRTTQWHKVRVLVAVWRVWRKFPHLRLGQLICNAVEGESGTPVFYRADEGVIGDLWVMDLRRRGLLRPKVWKLEDVPRRSL